jgi:hypothetical protein
MKNSTENISDTLFNYYVKRGVPRMIMYKTFNGSIFYTQKDPTYPRDRKYDFERFEIMRELTRRDINILNVKADILKFHSMPQNCNFIYDVSWFFEGVVRKDKINTLMIIFYDLITIKDALTNTQNANNDIANIIYHVERMMLELNPFINTVVNGLQMLKNYIEENGLQKNIIGKELYDQINLPLNFRPQFNYNTILFNMALISAIINKDVLCKLTSEKRNNILNVAQELNLFNWLIEPLTENKSKEERLKCVERITLYDKLINDACKPFGENSVNFGENLLDSKLASSKLKLDHLDEKEYSPAKHYKIKHNWTQRYAQEKQEQGQLNI